MICSLIRINRNREYGLSRRKPNLNNNTVVLCASFSLSGHVGRKTFYQYHFMAFVVTQVDTDQSVHHTIFCKNSFVRHKKESPVLQNPKQKVFFYLRTERHARILKILRQFLEIDEKLKMRF